VEANYVFADFELDGQRFELRKSGRRVTIQPKELRLLLYLVAHRGRVISKPELLQALWPDETVCAGSLKRAVRGLRRALGDDGEKQARIRTVRGYGYEFVQPLPQAASACEQHYEAHGSAREQHCDVLALQGLARLSASAGPPPATAGREVRAVRSA
jgi:DNA-binding winged helix-turn-helix (wHTH) protein